VYANRGGKGETSDNIRALCESERAVTDKRRARSLASDNIVHIIRRATSGGHERNTKAGGGSCTKERSGKFSYKKTGHRNREPGRSGCTQLSAAKQVQQRAKGRGAGTI